GRVGAVGPLVEHLPGYVRPEAVGQVAARVQRHAEHPLVAQIAAELGPVRVGQVVDLPRAELLQRRLFNAVGQHRPVGDQVRVDAGVRLDVRVRRAEQLTGVLGGDGLDRVDLGAAGVEPAADGAL